MKLPGITIDDIKRWAPNATIGPTTPVKKPAKHHKYNAKRTSIDGISFPSKREANLYTSLKIAHQAGKIKWFCRQPAFSIEGGSYVADFIVLNLDGSVDVIDAKGCKTAVYRRSKKQIMERYGIEIREV